MAKARRVAAVVIVVWVLAVACGSGSTGADSNGVDVVVTTPVLAAVVSGLAGPDANVDAVIPNGVDPHDFRLSAKDRASIGDADLLVVNGLGLESSLDDTIEVARSEGTVVFVAGDHVDVRRFGDDRSHGEPAESDHGDADEGKGEDPHFWVDPMAMKQVVAALADELIARPALGLREGMEERRAEVEASLDALDADVSSTLASIPTGRRVLVTGHESLGYFARRYDFRFVGAVIPSSTSQAASSSGQLASLRDEVEYYDVPAIFVELGTSTAVAESLASEVGVRVVELATHTLPPDGSYEAFMVALAEGVVEGLGES